MLNKLTQIVCATPGDALLKKQPSARGAAEG